MLLRRIKIFLIFIHMCNYLKFSLLFYSILFKRSSLVVLFLWLTLLCSLFKLIQFALSSERHAVYLYFMLFSQILFIQEFCSIFSLFSGFQVSNVNHSCISICLQLSTYTHIHTHTYACMPICTYIAAWVFFCLK